MSVHQNIQTKRLAAVNRTVKGSRQNNLHNIKECNINGGVKVAITMYDSKNISLKNGQED